MPTPFSRVYCIPEELMRDSERMRSRLGRYCVANLEDQRLHLVREVELETGARVPIIGMGHASLDRFFERAQLRDVLDSVTHIDRVLRVLQRPQTAAGWRQFVSRVLAEEHSAYEIQDDGSVVYKVDEAYAASRKATLAGLAEPRWNASRAEFERAFEAMDGNPADTNGAVRAMAAALEAASKAITNNVCARMGSTEIERYLWPVTEQAYAGDPVAQNAAHLQLKAYGDWVNATHQYRHGQDHEQQVRAPDELAISMLTVGSGILRWLVGVAPR